MPFWQEARNMILLHAWAKATMSNATWAKKKYLFVQIKDMQNVLYFHDTKEVQDHRKVRVQILQHRDPGTLTSILICTKSCFTRQILNIGISNPLFYKNYV